MTKTRGYSSVAAVIAVVLLISSLAGCSTASAPPPTAAPAKAPAAAAPAAPTAAPAAPAAAAPAAPTKAPAPAAPAAAPQTIRMTIGTGHPLETTSYVQQLRDFFIGYVKDQTTARTNYRIQFNEAWGGSVAKVDEALDAAQKGLLDVTNVSISTHPSKTPLQNFGFWVPFGPTSSVMAQKAAAKTIESFPVINSQFETDFNQKVLGITAMNDDYQLQSKVSWTKVDDFKGKKVGATPAIHFYLPPVGSTPIAASTADAYLNLQTGVMDAEVIAAEQAVAAKLYEVAPYFIQTHFGGVSPTSYVTINLDTWKKLAPEVQAIFVEAGQKYSVYHAEQTDKNAAAALETWKAKGGTVVEFPAEERAKWANLLPPDTITKQTEVAASRGLPAIKVVQAYMENLASLGYKSPRDWKW